jgi:hypothetical protein
VQTWEHIFTTCTYTVKTKSWNNGKTLQETANEFGRAGWELVSSTVTESKTAYSEFVQYHLAFKRPSAPSAGP